MLDTAGVSGSQDFFVPPLKFYLFYYFFYNKHYKIGFSNSFLSFQFFKLFKSIYLDWQSSQERELEFVKTKISAKLHFKKF